MHHHSATSNLAYYSLADRALRNCAFPERQFSPGEENHPTEWPDHFDMTASENYLPPLLPPPPKIETSPESSLHSLWQQEWLGKGGLSLNYNQVRTQKPLVQQSLLGS
jgi:hypothetical protein